MRWRVTYDLATSSWRSFGQHMDVRARDEAHARGLVERGLYARRDRILRDRHDDPGEGFAVTITSATELCARDGGRGR